MEANIDLDLLILVSHCTPIVGLLSAPCQLLNSRLLRTKLPITKANLKPKLQKWIMSKTKNYQTKYKTWYGKGTNKDTEYKSDQNTYLKIITKHGL